jgi:hypothetical protein
MLLFLDISHAKALGGGMLGIPVSAAKVRLASQGKRAMRTRSVRMVTVE